MIEYVVHNPYEVAGILTTLICVWLNIRQNIWGWFWAIISSAIYAWVYFQAKLYSDMELQFVFIIISIYGWWHWWQGQKTGNELKELPVTNCPTNIYWILILAFVTFSLGSGYFHQKYTDASLPYIDSSLTAISLLAQWLMARKYLENWTLWIVANVGYVFMYFSKNLTGTSILIYYYL